MLSHTGEEEKAKQEKPPPAHTQVHLNDGVRLRSLLSAMLWLMANISSNLSVAGLVVELVVSALISSVACGACTGTRTDLIIHTYPHHGDTLSDTHTTHKHGVIDPTTLFPHTVCD